MEKLGCSPKLRMQENKPFVTDNQNYILDCKFDKIVNPAELTVKINKIPGVVENGLFTNIATRIICNTEDGGITIIE